MSHGPRFSAILFAQFSGTPGHARALMERSDTYGTRPSRRPRIQRMRDRKSRVTVGSWQLGLPRHEHLGAVMKRLMTIDEGARAHRSVRLTVVGFRGGCRSSEDGRPQVRPVQSRHPPIWVGDEHVRNEPSVSEIPRTTHLTVLRSWPGQGRVRPGLGRGEHRLGPSGLCAGHAFGGSRRQKSVFRSSDAPVSRLRPSQFRRPSAR
jgi:hypothetical protein